MGDEIYMLVKYDGLEEFLKKLDTLEKKTPLYVKGIKQINKSNQIVSNISIQALNGEVCYQIVYTEDLPVFQLVPEGFWSAIPDENIRNQARESYTKSAKEYDTKLEAEYNKMVKILKDKGFTRIEDAVIE